MQFAKEAVQKVSPRTVTRDKNKEDMHVIIAGAGITGLSTAYYLLKEHNIKSTIVDITGTIAPGASGKAAGFLAKDWNDGSPTEALTHRSFDLHQELADTFGAEKIQYRRVNALSAKVEDTVKPPVKSKKPYKESVTASKVEWADLNYMRNAASLGDEDTVAQVHPKLLCEHLWKACEEQGCTLRKGKVIGTAAYGKGKLHGQLRAALLDDGSEIEADSLLYACGPWVANVMFGIKGHSLVLPTTRQLKQSVFFSSESYGDCEVFVRPDDTAYCSGFPEDLVKVKELPGEEEVEPEKVDRLLNAVRHCSGKMTNPDDKKTKRSVLGAQITSQACYQPVTEDFLPVIGRLPTTSTGGAENCYMAGGNNCWGILLGPATGECIADLMAYDLTSGFLIDGDNKEALKEVDNIYRFRPERFRDLRPTTTIKG